MDWFDPVGDQDKSLARAVHPPEGHEFRYARVDGGPGWSHIWSWGQDVPMSTDIFKGFTTWDAEPDLTSVGVWVRTRPGKPSNAGYPVNQRPSTRISPHTMTG